MKPMRVVGQNETSRKIAYALDVAEVETDDHSSIEIVTDWQSLNTLSGYSEERRLPWMLIEETHSEGAAVGPIFDPQGGGCFRCYIHRRRSNGGQECRPLRDASPTMIGHIARAIGMFASGRSDWDSEQLEIFADGHIQSHVFLPVPSCERCRGRQTRHHGLSLRSLVSERIGLVHEVREVANVGPLKAAVASGCRTDAFSETQALNRGMAVDETLDSAWDRASGESIERYCSALAPADIPMARADELDGPFLDPAHSADLKGRTDGRSCFRWVRATSLLTGKDVWAPASRGLCTLRPGQL